MEPRDQRSRENDVLEAQLFCLLRMLQEVSAWLQDGGSERDEKGRKRDGLGCHRKIYGKDLANLRFL